MMDRSLPTEHRGNEIKPSSSSSSVSSITELPSDCKGRIFEYLSYKQCCRYGQTSGMSLSDILPELQRRRRCQFFSSYQYYFHSKTNTLIVESTVKNKNDDAEATAAMVTMTTSQKKTRTKKRSSNKNHDVDDVDEEEEEKVINVMPTVTERIQCLYRIVPMSSPLNDELRELVLDLKTETIPPEYQNSTTKIMSNKTHNIDKLQENETGDDSTTIFDKRTLSFRTLFDQFRRLTKAHRLHATILARCTIHCQVSDSSPSNGTTENPNKFSISLERYMGDVLCATFLMGHSIASIVEASPTHADWATTLIRQTTSNQRASTTTTTNAENGAIVTNDTTTLGTTSSSSSSSSEFSQLSSFASPSARSSYSYIVYLHSSLLRIMPMTRSQWEILLGPLISGIPGGMVLSTPTFINGIENEMSDNFMEYLHPHFPYVGVFSPSILRERGDVIANCPLTLVGGRIETITHQFGPLGPAFRGRDNIQVLELPIQHLLRRLGDGAYSFPLYWSSNQYYIPEMLSSASASSDVRPSTMTSMSAATTSTGSNLSNQNDNNDQQQQGQEQQQRWVELRTSPHYQFWFTGDDQVMSWMIRLKQESMQIRPMTVQSPIVSICLN